MARRHRKLQRIEENRPQRSREVDNTRGSTLWAFNHYRSNVLTSLLNDLIDLENDGLAEEYCSYVRSSLEKFANASTEVPSGGFLTGRLYKEVEQFSSLYKDWNSVEGKDPKKVAERRKLLVALRKQRQRITDKTRSLQWELNSDLDRKVVASTYKAIGDLIELVPNLFNNLAGAFGDYLKRGGFLTA